MWRSGIPARMPPATRPSIEPPMKATWLIPIAFPRSFGGNASVRSAAELANRNDAPTAWISRNPTSAQAPVLPDQGSTNRRIDPVEKIANPRLYIRARPHMSESRPTVTRSVAVTTP